MEKPQIESYKIRTTKQLKLLDIKIYFYIWHTCKYNAHVVGVVSVNARYDACVSHMRVVI